MATRTSLQIKALSYKAATICRVCSLIARWWKRPWTRDTRKCFESFAKGRQWRALSLVHLVWRKSSLRNYAIHSSVPTLLVSVVLFFDFLSEIGNVVIDGVGVPLCLLLMDICREFTHLIFMAINSCSSPDPCLRISLETLSLYRTLEGGRLEYIQVITHFSRCKLIPENVLFKRNCYNPWEFPNSSLVYRKLRSRYFGTLENWFFAVLIFWHIYNVCCS